MIARLIVPCSGLFMVPNHFMLNIFGYAVLFGIFYREKIYPMIGVKGGDG